MRFSSVLFIGLRVFRDMNVWLDDPLDRHTALSKLHNDGVGLLTTPITLILLRAGFIIVPPIAWRIEVMDFCERHSGKRRSRSPSDAIDPRPGTALGSALAAAAIARQDTDLRMIGQPSLDRCDLSIR
jgi:hypothetical protein